MGKILVVQAFITLTAYIITLGTTMTYTRPTLLLYTAQLWDRRNCRIGFITARTSETWRLEVNEIALLDGLPYSINLRYIALTKLIHWVYTISSYAS